MIAIAKPTKTNKQYTEEEIHAKFLELMPLITRIAKGAFQNYSYHQNQFTKISRFAKVQIKRRFGRKYQYPPLPLLCACQVMSVPLARRDTVF